MSFHPVTRTGSVGKVKFSPYLTQESMKKDKLHDGTKGGGGGGQKYSTN